jgi:RHS repeat-associated protein
VRFFAFALLIALLPGDIAQAQSGSGVVAIVRHAPDLNGNGFIDGSLQQLLGERVMLNGGFLMTGDLLVPGTPSLKLNGEPKLAGTIAGTGNASPDQYNVILNGNCSLNYLRTRTTPVALPTVTPPPPPSGSRAVIVTSAGQSIGDAATLRDLTLNGNVGQVAVLPGNYGEFTANGGSGFILGLPGATNAAVYNLQNLKLNGTCRLDVVGPVILKVAAGFTANGLVGAADHPSWLQLQAASGGITLNGGCTIYGSITAPAGTVVVNGNSCVIGSVQSDRLTLNGGGCIRAEQTPNLPPVGDAQNVSLPEDTILNITLTGSDPEGASLTYTVLSQPPHGTLSGTAPNLAYRPVTNFNGIDGFIFKVNDGSSDSAAAAVSITVTPVNDLPVAQSQALSTPEETPLTVTLLATDVENDPLTFQIDTLPSHGTLSGAAPNLTYTPALDYNGLDSFTYRANDGQGFSAPAMVAITVQPVDDAPVGNAQTVGTAEDIPVPITLSGADVEGAPMVFTVLTPPTHGTLAGAAPDLIYSPATNYHGADSFTFTASDGSLESAPATIAIIVQPVNDPPVAEAAAFVINEDTATNIVLTGSDVDGDSLSFTILSQPSHGTLSGIAPNVAYSPAANFFGHDSFTFQTDDGQTNSASATVTLTVLPVNDAPVANAAALSLDEDTSLSITLAATDVESDPLTFHVLTQPLHGTLSGAPPHLIYRPATNYFGDDSFTFEARDPETNSEPATITLTIRAVNDPPVADDLSLSAAENIPLNLVLTGSDVDSSALTFSVVTQPLHGTLSGAAPNLTYTPAAGFHGNDSFTFVVDDESTNSAVATVSITVDRSVNDAPTASGQQIYTPEDVPVNITLGAEAADTAALNFHIVQTTSHGSLSGTAPDIVYHPTQDFFGDDAFTFVVDDGNAVSAPATILVSVTPVNDAPRLAVPGGQIVGDDLPLIFDDSRSITVTDVDAGAASLRLSLSVSNGTLTLSSTNGLAWLAGSNGSTAIIVNGALNDLNAALTNLTYLPGTNFVGVDTLALSVDDLGNTGAGGSLTDARMVAITVVLTNHVPFFVSTPVTDVDSFPLLSQPVALNLKPWQVVQYDGAAGDALWRLHEHDAVAFQENNSEPSMLVSDFTMFRERIEGDLTATDSTDDDFMGFVFGFQDRGHFYLFDWRQVDQDAGVMGFRGMSVKVFTADPGFGGDKFWATYSTASNVVHTIYHNDIPYEFFKPYHFILEYQPGDITITLKDGANVVTNFHLADTTYPAGKFGFYNDSEAGILYSGFTRTPVLAHAYSYQATAIDPDGDPVSYSLFIAPTNMTIDSATGLINWQPGAELVGTVAVTVQATDSHNGAGFQTFSIEVPPPIVNRRPFVNAGPDRSFAQTPNSITLDGEVVDDGVPANTPLAINWSNLFSQASVTFGSSTSAVSTASFATPGLYVLQLSASDSLESASDLAEVRAGILCSVQVPAGLVAWWPGNATTNEVIGHRQTALHEYTGFGPGKVGPAFTFGQNTNYPNKDCIRIPADTNLDIGRSPDGFTIEFWAKAPTGGTRGILSWSNNIARGLQVYETTAALNVNLVETNGTFHGPYIVDGVFNDTWRHVAVTYNRPLGQLRIYVDGTLQLDQIVGSFANQTSLDLFVGAVPGLEFNFYGSIDELSLYRRPLDPEEIYNIFAADIAGKCPVDANHVPEVYAGPDRFVTGIPGMTTLEGEVRDDSLPDGNGLQVQWRKLSGPGTVTFDNANSPVTSATFSSNGVYVLQLEAQDGEAFSSDRVEVRVEAICTVENPQGLAAWWPANGSGLEMLGGQAAIPGSGAAYASGQVAMAFQFDGVNDFVQIPARTNYDIGDSASGFTIEFWVKAATGGTRGLMSWTNGVARGLQMYETGDTLNLNLVETNGAFHGPYIVGGVFNDVWHHVALTYDRPSGVLRVYLDSAVKIDRSVGSFANQTSLDLILGATPDLRLGFLGWIDELSLYRRPLSADEVHSVYISGSVGKCPVDNNQAPVVFAGPDLSLSSTSTVAVLNGVVADDGLPVGPGVRIQWSKIGGAGSVNFNSPTSALTTATFSASGIYTLQLTADDGEVQSVDFAEVRVGMPCVLSDLPGLKAFWPLNGNTMEKFGGESGMPIGNVSFSAGKVDKALQFDGNGSYVQIRPRTNYDVGTSAAGFTIEFWANAPASGTRGVLSFADVDHRGVQMYQSGSTLNTSLVETGGAFHDLFSVTAFNGTWQHIALTYDRVAGQARTYVNGVLQGPVQNVGSFANQTAVDLYLGVTPGVSGYFVGGIDELSLYDRPLSQPEIQAIANAGAAGKCLTPPNRPPGVLAGPDKTITLPTNSVTLNGVVFDDALPATNTLVVSWNLVSGPSTAFFDNSNSPVANVAFTNGGVYTFQLTASDGQFTTNDTVVVTVLPDPRIAPTITLTTPRTVVGVAFEDTADFTLMASASDVDDYVPKIEFFQGDTSVSVQNNNPAALDLTDFTPGNYTFTAVATDNSGLSTTSAPLTVIVFVDDGPPEVELFKPEDSSIVTAPTNIIGTVKSSILQSYALRYRLAPAATNADIPISDGSWGTLATGATAVLSNRLALFDPTLLLNGIYEVQLVASDLVGRTNYSEVQTLIVDRNLKIGQFTISFNDLAVPVPGLPLQITRSYDSRAAAAGVQGDFGIGWTMDIRNVRLQKNRPLGRNWVESTSGSAFDLSLAYHLDPIQARIVTITFPDGRVEKFELDPNPLDQPLAPIEFPQWRFTPLDNTRGTLVPATYDDPGGKFLWAVGDIPGTVDLYDLNFFTVDPFADDLELNRYPTLFRYTSPEGYQYLIDEVEGLQCVTDPNGNTLVIGTNSITWTNPDAGTNSLSVFFQRDSQNRITNIVDAAGNSMSYGYDATGNLVNFTDRVGNTNAFQYANTTFPHHLTGIVDGRGVHALGNSYDGDGRLVATEDAAGNSVGYGHDLANYREYVTNRLGYVTVSEYDSLGRTIRRTNPLGLATSFEFDAFDNVLSVSNGACNCASHFAYDDEDNLLSKTDELGNQQVYTYNDLRKVLSYTDADGNVTTNSFDSQGNLLSTTDPLGNQSTFTYNNLGRVSTMTDPNGGVTRYDYDSWGRLTRKTDALGNPTDYTVDANGNPTRITQYRTEIADSIMQSTGGRSNKSDVGSEAVARTEAAGVKGGPARIQSSATKILADGAPIITNIVISYRYDISGKLLAVLMPDGTGMTNDYNEIERIVDTTDELGRETKTDYNMVGNPIKITYSDRSTEEMTYDAEGQLLSHVDRADRRTSFEYDPAGRIQKVTYPDGLQVTATYDDRGHLLSEEDSCNRRYEYTYDAVGNRIASKDPAGHTTEYKYNTKHACTEVKDPLGHVTTMFYNALNCNVGIHHPDGGIRSAEFHGRLVTKITETLGSSGGTRQKFFTYDPVGRLASVTDWEGNATSFEYDETGNCRTITDAKGNKTTRHYDQKNRCDRAIAPDGAIRYFTYDNIGRLLTTSGSAGTVRYTYDDQDNLTSVTEPLGKTTSYSYNKLGQRTSQSGDVVPTMESYDQAGRHTGTSYPDGSSETTVYDGCGHATGFINRAGGVTQYGYDALGRVTSIVDPLGHTTTFLRDELGNILSRKDAKGGTTTYEYDEMNRMTSEHLPDGAVLHFGYDYTGHLISRTDGMGFSTTFGVDGNGRVLSETDPLGGTKTYSYDPQGKLASFTDEIGRQTHYNYDSGERLVEIIRPTARETFSYDLRDLMLSQTDANDHTTTFEYDDLGQMTKRTDAENRSTAFEYDLFGHVISITDAKSRKTSLEYNLMGQVTKKTYPGGAIETSTYDLAGRLASQTDANGHTTEFDYDVAGQLISSKDPLGHVTAFTYDELGQIAQRTANGHTTAFAYDPMERVNSISHPDGSLEAREYDKGGRLTASVDEASARTEFSYDKVGRLTSVKDAAGNTTSYGYDLAGQLTSTVDAKGFPTTYDYDQLGHRASRGLPTGEFEFTTYDGAGNLIAHKDFAGRSCTYEYDKVNELVRRVPGITFGEVATTYEYDNTGNRTVMTDPAGRTEYTYDNNRDWLVGKKRSWNDSGTSASLLYSHDSVGNVLGMTSSVANGASVGYSYDNDDRLATVVDAFSGVTRYNYDAADNLVSITRPNGLQTSLGYDARDRLTDLTTRNAQNQSLTSFTYSYGPAGNRLTAAETINNNGTTKTINRSFDYDNVYRLSGETFSGTDYPTPASITYTYDKVGNRLTRASNLAGLDPQSFTYNSDSRLTSDTYDANGNTITGHVMPGGTASVDQYDSADRLVLRQTTVNGQPLGIGYQYDGDGNRVGKRVNGVTTHFQVDELSPAGSPQVVEEHTWDTTSPLYSSPAVTQVYSHGLTPLSQGRFDGTSWTTTHFGQDGHGNVRYLTDDAGQVTDTIDYEAFGSIIARTGATPTSRLFTGEEYDPDLGLYNLRARYHNPNTGRFWTQDRVEGRIEDPRTLNLYAYAANNPVNFIDPSGHDFGETMMASHIGLSTTMSGLNLLLGASTALQQAARLSNSSGTQDPTQAFFTQSFSGNANWMAGKQEDFWNVVKNVGFLLQANPYVVAPVIPACYRVVSFDPDAPVLGAFPENLCFVLPPPMSPEGSKIPLVGRPGNYPLEAKYAAWKYGTCGGQVEEPGVGPIVDETWYASIATWLGQGLREQGEFPPSDSTWANFFSYNQQTVANVLANFVETPARIGKGSFSAAYNAKNGWDKAIGYSEDIVDAAAIFTTLLGPLEEVMSGTVEEAAAEGATQSEVAQLKSANGIVPNVAQTEFAFARDLETVLAKSAPAEVEAATLTAANESAVGQLELDFAAKGGDDLYASTMRQVENLDFTTGANKAVFYSGPGNRARALAFADRTGAMPIDLTPGGQYLNSLNLYGKLPAAQADAIWARASQFYASGASGKINLFVRGARLDRVFNTIERPLIDVNSGIYKQTFHY